MYLLVKQGRDERYTLKEMPRTYFYFTSVQLSGSSKYENTPSEDEVFAYWWSCGEPPPGPKGNLLSVYKLSFIQILYYETHLRNETKMMSS